MRDAFLGKRLRRLPLPIAFMPTRTSHDPAPGVAKGPPLRSSPRLPLIAARWWQRDWKVLLDRFVCRAEVLRIGLRKHGRDRSGLPSSGFLKPIGHEPRIVLGSFATRVLTPAAEQPLQDDGKPAEAEKNDGKGIKRREE